MFASRRLGRVLAFFAWFACVAVHAEIGVSDTVINVGQSADLSGPVSETGTSYRNGLQLYFDEINKSGGVNGRKIHLTSLDDRYEPARTVENTRLLIEKEKVFALVGYVATPNLIAAMPLADAAKVPMFGPLTGTTALRNKHNHYLFFARASFRDELKSIARQLTVVGNTKVAVVYLDGSFGTSNLQTLQEIVDIDKKIEIVASIPMALAADNALAIAEQLKKSQASAVIMIMAGGMSEVLVRDLRATNFGAPIYTISIGFADPRASAKKLNGNLRGVITASTVPSPKLERYAIVKEFRRAVGTTANQDENYTMLEGFIVGKAFVEGIRRSGRNLTREGFITALEGAGSIDLGDYRVEYSPVNHGGSSAVDLEMYTATGALLR